MKSLMRKLAGWMLATALALSPAVASAVPLIDNDEVKADIGFRLQQMGQFTNVTSYNSYLDAPASGYTGQRDLTRIYLNTMESRLKMMGKVNGIKLYFEQSLGAETALNSDNLLEALGVVPVTDNVSFYVGQYKVPTYRSSAIYSEDGLFATRSWLGNLFFNQGYENGVGLLYQSEGASVLLGTSAMSPNLPQRFLPMVFKGPPVTGRISIGSAQDDVFRQKQAVRVDEAEWALNINGQYAPDSKAGHTNLLGRQSGFFTGANAPALIGNAILTSAYNPILGKTSTSNGPIDAYYANAGVDFIYRRPMGDTTLIFEALYHWAVYRNNDLGGLAISATEVEKDAQVTASGGEVVLGLLGEKWGVATRFNMVMPDRLIGKVSGGNFISYFGTENIYEVVLPAITYRHNENFKVIAEMLFWLNSPEVNGDSGVYQVLEVPTRASSGDLTVTNPMVRSQLVTIGRMMAQISF